MRESKAGTPLQTPVNGGVVNQIKNHAFSLEEYRIKMDEVDEDYKKYRQILDEIEKRVQKLEEILRKKKRLRRRARVRPKPDDLFDGMVLERGKPAAQ